jgi:hypothetical protein
MEADNKDIHIYRFFVEYIFYVTDYNDGDEAKLLSLY